ncbi:dienelactone hydrolase family protein [Streptomyces sp. CA-210063]|uniref:dienelactone hydrolase family protein n=1 Tax=Streptomyces sp. CA-210063 TaxID=2801029 RepID=UPI003FA74F94
MRPGPRSGREDRRSHAAARRFRRPTIPAAQAAAIDAALSAAEVDFESYVFRGPSAAGHAFACDARRRLYVEESARTAWQHPDHPYRGARPRRRPHRCQRHRGRRRAHRVRRPAVRHLANGDVRMVWRARGQARRASAWA